FAYTSTLLMWVLCLLDDCVYSFFFFFQAEDGIRDRNVTGVQTCALPIYIKSMWTRFFWSTIFTIPLFYISMGHLIGLPLPGIINPTVNPESFSLVQLILTLPVVILGRKFYTVGFKTL